MDVRDAVAGCGGVADEDRAGQFTKEGGRGPSCSLFPAWVSRRRSYTGWAGGGIEGGVVAVTVAVTTVVMVDAVGGGRVGGAATQRCG